MRVLFFVSLALLSFPAMAYDLESEKIEGVSLDMSMEQARSVLEAKGYKEQKSPYESVNEAGKLLVFKKGSYTISVLRGFSLSSMDTLRGAKQDPNMLIEISQKKDMAGHTPDDSEPRHCKIAVDAAEKFCNDSIETPNKDCSLRTRVELRETNDRFKFRYEAFFAPGRYCYKLVVRTPAFRN